MKSYKNIALLLCVAVLTSCFHDEETAVSKLKGNWKGVYRNANGVFTSLTAGIDDDGNITSLQVFNQPALSGSLRSTGDKTYSFILSDGTEGGFLADDAGNHLGFLTTDNDYGLLEKGATLRYADPNNFGRGHFVGSWSGYSVELNYAMDVIRQYSSSANIPSQTLTVSGVSDGESFSGQFDYQDNSKGYAYGTYSSMSSSGNMVAIISPDKSFIASWACGSSASSSLAIYDIEACAFAMWNKN